jgi:hypothetical protein
VQEKRKYFITERGKMIMFNCDSYSGVTCVDGGCPDALAEEYSDYGYTHTDCSECAYYRGCKDCYFNRESRCAVYDKDIQWVLTIEEKKLLESVYSKESEEFYE